MGLGIVTKSSGEDFLPHVKLNSVSGDFEFVKRVQNSSGEWEKEVDEIAFPAEMIFDFDNVEVGWIHFSSQGPDFVMVKPNEIFPPLPSKEHKKGFRIKLFCKKRGLALFSATSNTIKEAFDSLYDAYESGKSANASKVPVVRIDGTTKLQTKTKEGTKTFRAPKWEIIKWVDRPEAMKVGQGEVEEDEPTF